MGRHFRSVWLCTVIVVLFALVSLVGCGGSGSKTQFRIMNAIPDESGLDLLVDSTSVATNVAYGTSSSYQAVQSGSRTLQINPAGGSNALLTQSVSFAGGSDTTILASNFSSSATFLVLTDDNSAPSSSDFKLRLINSAPGLGAADIYIETPGTDLNTVSPTAGNIGFNGVLNYQSLAAGSYEIMFTPVGQKFIVIDSGSLTFSAGQVRTFVGLNSQAGGFTYTMLHDVN